MLDLEPATRDLAVLIGNITDEQLGAPTPCTAYTLGDLLDHVGGLAMAFTLAARKTTDAVRPQAQMGAAAGLADEWRARIPRDLAALAEAWRDPAAWTGMTRAGGIDLPSEVAGAVAVDELVVHAWDIARATGQAFAGDRASLDAALAVLAQFSGPGQEAPRGGAFGPVVPVPPRAPLLDRVIGMSGRDPGWTPG